LIAQVFLLLAGSLNEGAKRVPATISAVADAVRWAEEIMREIDNRWPAGAKAGTS